MKLINRALLGVLIVLTLPLSLIVVFVIWILQGWSAAEREDR
jgi:hypothetical protein